MINTKGFITKKLTIAMSVLLLTSQSYVFAQQTVQAVHRSKRQHHNNSLNQSVKNIPYISNQLRDQNSQVISQAFSYNSHAPASVDPRTGELSLVFPVAKLFANVMHGPSQSLSVAYDQGNNNNPYHIVDGWSFNLPFIIMPSGGNPDATLNLGNGQTYSIIKDMTQLQYAKLNGKQFAYQYIPDKKEILFTSKDGSTITLSPRSSEAKYYVVTQMSNAAGYTIHFTYTNQVLSSIAGTTGLQHITIQNNIVAGNGVTTISSDDTQGKMISFTLKASDNKIQSIVNPLGQSTILKYALENQDDPDSPYLLSEIDSPLGSKTFIKYVGKMMGLSGYGLPGPLNNQGTPYYYLPAVSSLTINPETVNPITKVAEPSHTTQYKYMLKGHDYLGYKSGLGNPQGQDPLLTMPISYSYQTSVTTTENGQKISIIRSYNHLAMQTSVETVNETNGTLISKQTASYAPWQGIPFSALSDTYDKPITKTTTAYAINDVGQASGYQKTTLYRYDQAGNLTHVTYPDGRQLSVSYYPEGYLNLPGFERLAKTSTLYPSSTQNGNLIPLQSSQSISATKSPNGILVPEIQSVSLYYLSNSDSPSLINKRSFKYYTSANLFGLKKSTTISDTNNDHITQTNTINESDFNYNISQNTTGTQAVNSLSTASSSQKYSRYNNAVISNTNALGNVTNYQYDALGRIIQVTQFADSSHPLVTHYQYKINPNGDGVSDVIVTDPMGVKTQYQLDSQGRVLTTAIQSLTNPQEFITLSSKVYNSTNEVVSATSYGSDQLKDPMTTTYEYNGLGELVKVTFPNGISSHEIYDNKDNSKVAYMTDKADHINGYITLTHYNIDGQVKAVDLYNPKAYQSNVDNSDALLENLLSNTPTLVSSNSYDGFGRLVKSTDFQGNITQLIYNAQGQVTEKLLPNGNTLHYIYNALFNAPTKVILTTPIQSITLGTMSYNSLGEVIKSSNPEGYSASSTYNKYGQLTSSTSANGHTLDYSYNNEGQLIEVKVSGLLGQVLKRYSYDPITRRLVKVSDGSHNSIQYNYDAYGRIISKTIQYANQPAQSIDYHYGPTGRLLSVNGINGQTQSMSYNQDGSIDEISYNNGQEKLNYSYSVTGAIAKVTRDVPSGQFVTSYTRNDLNQLLALSNTYDNKPLNTFEYDYGPYGKIISTTRLGATGTTTFNKTYGYDQFSRLISYYCTGTMCPHDQLGNVIDSQHYQFDALNNITSITEELTNEKSSSMIPFTNIMKFNYSSNDPFQLLNYTNTAKGYKNSDLMSYDKDGNLVVDSKGNNITYNDEDQAVKIKEKGLSGQDIVSYAYGPDGNQIKESSKDTNIYTYYDNGAPIAKSENGTILNYLPGIGKIYHGKVTTLVTAANGSVTNSFTSGQETGKYAYSPYGIKTDYLSTGLPKITIPGLSLSLNTTGYNGMQTDPITGWQFLGNGYRAYSPVLKRFTKWDSMSPFGAGGINGYSYVSNDPINASDPTGHMSAKSFFHHMSHPTGNRWGDIVVDSVANTVTMGLYGEVAGIGTAASYGDKQDAIFEGAMAWQGSDLGPIGGFLSDFLYQRYGDHRSAKQSAIYGSENGTGYLGSAAAAGYDLDLGITTGNWTPMEDFAVSAAVSLVIVIIFDKIMSKPPEPEDELQQDQWSGENSNDIIDQATRNVEVVDSSDSNMRSKIQKLSREKRLEMWGTNEYSMLSPDNQSEFSLAMVRELQQARFTAEVNYLVKSNDLDASFINSFPNDSTMQALGKRLADKEYSPGLNELADKDASIRSEFDTYIEELQKNKEPVTTERYKQFSERMKQIFATNPNP